ncbi:hypothetical protein N656DRAFT_829416 [Canariomyces notabilis]|uniref:Ankyrin repeat protein n=1 Tax=Canariomyces notabilis TaxID=2074819 RepID=A0AAN6TCV8_9PEZI|nr:hypothetical protein N656DRAFT_829416 [Canariomyces arenarius]
MDTLLNHCMSGTLTPTLLRSQLSSSSNPEPDSKPHLDINAIHPTKGITLLIAAIFKSHPTTVSLLLSTGHANRNTSSRDGVTPLCWATTATLKHHAQIVSLLLNAGADVDGTCETLRNETPFMLTLCESRDTEVIKLLVEAGASFTAPSKKGETVEDVARRVGALGDPGVKAALYPRESRLNLEEVVRVICAVIGIVVAWVNSATVERVIGGGGVVKEMGEVVKKWHGLEGRRDESLEKEMWEKEPRTVEEFRESIDKYVTKTGLDTFFSGANKTFLQTVAEKATDLLNDPMDPLSSPENVRTLIALNGSGSMLQGSRAQAQAALVERIARVATLLVPKEGVHLRFINSSSDDLDNLDVQGVKNKMKALRITKGSYTQIGTGLEEKILRPFVHDPLDNDQELTRPLLVCITTDGYPENPPAIGPLRGRETFDKTVDAIYEFGERLERDERYPRTGVRFLISQIGRDSKAEKFLDALDKDTRLSDVVHVTAEKLDDRWVELRDHERHLEEWLLRTLLAPIVEKGLD